MSETRFDAPGIRAIKRDAFRSIAAARAVEIFDERGFDETTVEELAIAIGISTRSFFRYFPTKEDVIFGGLVPLGEQVRDALARRPSDEVPWTALRQAFDEVMVPPTVADPDGALRITRVSMSTPALRGRNQEKHIAWADLLTPLIQKRLGRRADPDAIAARALVQSSLACLDVAFLAWVASNGTRPLRALLEQAFGAVSSVGNRRTN